MEEQRGSADETDQQKKVKFDEEEPESRRASPDKGKPAANQDRDNKRESKEREREDEDDEGRASRASRSSRVSSATADNNSAISDEQKLEKQGTDTDDSAYTNNSAKKPRHDDEHGNSDSTNEVKQVQQHEASFGKSDEEKLNTGQDELTQEDKADDVSKKDEPILQTHSEDNSNSNQRRTSYSLNSRKKESRDSESSNTEQVEYTQDDADFETDDDKVSKKSITSARSTKSNTSAKYMTWNGNQSENDSIKEEVRQTDDEKKEQKTSDNNESKPVTKDEDDQKQAEDKDNNQTQKTSNTPKRQESPNKINTVTLVTKRQSETQTTPRDQKKDVYNRRHMSKSATYPSSHKQTTRGVPTSTRASSRASTLRSYRPPSRPRTTLGFDPERRRENDFFHKELQRLKDSLRKESKSIKKPKVRDHYPDVFTSLAPYYNTYTANYLIKMPDLGYKEKQPAEVKKAEEEENDKLYYTRCTAIGLCDPWDSLNMDKSVLPKLETAEIRKKRIEQMHASDTNKPKSARASSNTDRNSQSQSGRRSTDTDQESNKQKRPEAKQGSTRLPKFPVIVPPNSDLSTKELHYGDVPMLRDELVRSFSHFGEDRKNSDYKRTKQDFYRMELDRLAEYHHTSRPNMRRAYFAYLQNTPGSRKAIYDCMKEMDNPKKKEEPTAQAVA